MKKGKAKSLVMQRHYRSQVVRDKTKYRRKPKHKKAPDSGAFLCFMSSGMASAILLGNQFHGCPPAYFRPLTACMWQS